MRKRFYYVILSAIVLCMVLPAALGGDLPDEVRKEFTRLIGSPKPEDRAQAIPLLSQADDQKALKYLSKILDQEQDEKVIAACFEIMKKFKDAGAISAVCKMAVKCKVMEQRVEYVRVLWGCDSDEAFNTVLKFMKDSEWQVRMTVADCLGETAKTKGFEKARDVIDRLLKWVFAEPDGRTQNRVLAALYYLTGKDYGLDKEAWKAWWDHEKPNYGKPKVDEDGKPVDKDGDGKPDMTTELPKEQWRPPEVKEGNRPKFFGHELKNARVIFVIDRTGSMNEASSGGKTKLQVLKDELVKTISAFDKRYWFNMYFYSTGCMIWKPKLQQATDDLKKEAVTFVTNLVGMGMTDIAGALRRASEDPDADTIILLSDGKPTAGITDTNELLKDIQKWNKFKKIKINTVGMVGCDPNMLQQIAQQNGGAFTQAP
jgi:hypothetical protein